MNYNKDFYSELPGEVCIILDNLIKKYSSRPWFNKAWNDYRNHVKKTDINSIKMPGYIFNNYIYENVAHSYLCHYGVKGMKWGVINETKNERKVFISGSSKTQTEDSGYYRKELPEDVSKYIDELMQDNAKVIVGDAPGIDRQVQDYLNKKGYKNVEVFGPGKKVRYSANSEWKTNPIDAPEFEEGSKEWLAKKDKAMEEASTEGLAIVLENGGAGATRNNVQRLLSKGKPTKVYELTSVGKDYWSNEYEKFNHSETGKEYINNILK